MAVAPLYLADKSALARLAHPEVSDRLGPLLVDGLVATCPIIDLEVLYSARSIARAQIKGRLLLSDAEQKTLAAIGYRLGRKALDDVANTAKPDTILGWSGAHHAVRVDALGLGQGGRRAAAGVQKRETGATHCESVDAARKRHQAFVDRVAPAVRNIYAYWLARRAAPTGEKPRGPQRPLRKASSPGRNDPCPCGSGKKFKRCHGAPQTLH